METILMSIRPKWVAKILNGEKTIEVRKTRPKCDTPFKVYIYCTKGKKLYNNKNGQIPMLKMFGLLTDNDIINGKVVAEFTCDKIDHIVFDGNAYIIKNESKAYTNKVAAQSCLMYDDMFDYLGDKGGYGWHISDLKIYDKPKELSEFKKQNACYYCGYLITRLGVDAVVCNESCASFDNGDCDGRCSKLGKAPQSWCYVEE